MNTSICENLVFISGHLTFSQLDFVGSKFLVKKSFKRGVYVGIQKLNSKLWQRSNKLQEKLFGRGIAYRKGYVSQEQLMELGKALAGNSYGAYVMEVARQDS
jgi:hypothetical protein